MCQHNITQLVRVECEHGPYAAHQCQLCGLVLQQDVTPEELAQLHSLPVADNGAYAMAVGDSIDRWRRNRDRHTNTLTTLFGRRYDDPRR